jgi:hypothetical protein
MGMPTIVVVGNNEHKVFYKSIGYTPAIDDLIREAIDSALLYNPTGINEKIPSGAFRIYPTLFSDQLYVETNMEYADAEMIIFDAFGRQVLIFHIPQGGWASIPVEGLSKGLYIARLKKNKGLSDGIRLIRQ